MTRARPSAILSRLALSAALMLMTAGPATRAGAAPNFPSVLLPSKGAYFGTFVKPRSGETPQQAIARVESAISRRFAIDHRYYHWNTDFPTAYDVWTASHGRIPYINWEAERDTGSLVTWSSIASGARDALIIKRAKAIKAFGKPMYLTFHHEPENDPALGSSSDYIRAFRHIVSIFRAQGVTNVAWVVALEGYSYINGSARTWYPGDRYVDFVGCDSYNWYPGKPGSKWRSFHDGVAATVAFAQVHAKPVMVSEYGVQEDPAVPGRKGQWFLDELTSLEAWPRIKAVVYFDSPTIYPWITDSSTSSITDYAKIAQSAWLNATG
jgi:hypothetical protein